MGAVAVRKKRKYEDMSREDIRGEDVNREGTSGVKKGEKI